MLISAYKILIISSMLIFLIVPNFSFSQEVDGLELPEGVEVPQSWTDAFWNGVKGAWEQCLRIWRRMWEFFKNIWNKYIVSFFRNLWEKIKAPFVRKVKETEEIIEEEIEKKGLWERFKDLFRTSD